MLGIWIGNGRNVGKLVRMFSTPFGECPTIADLMRFIYTGFLNPTYGENYMNRLMMSLSGVVAALVLVGCASEPTSSAPAAAAPAAKPAATAPAAAMPAAPAAPALTDAQIAEKFKGQWTGEWVMPGFGSGKFVFIGNTVEGNNIKGEAHWYGTAAGDLKLPLLKAVVEKGVLKAEQVGDTKFKLKLKSDTDMAGDWDIKGYTGDLLKLKRE
jgi:hypothetical protein